MPDGTLWGREYGSGGQHPPTNIQYTGGNASISNAVVHTLYGSREYIYWTAYQERALPYRGGLRR